MRHRHQRPAQWGRLAFHFLLLWILGTTTAALAQHDPDVPAGWQFDDSFRAAGVLRYTAPDGSVRVELSAQAPTDLTASVWLDQYASRYKKDHEILTLTAAKRDEDIIEQARATNSEVVDAAYLEIVKRYRDNPPEHHMLAAAVRAGKPVQLTFVQLLEETPNLAAYVDTAERLAAQSNMPLLDASVALEKGLAGVDLNKLAEQVKAEVQAELKAEKRARSLAPDSSRQPTDKSTRSSKSDGPLVGRMVGRRSGQTLFGLDLSSGRYQPLPDFADLISSGALNSDSSVVTRRDRSVPSGRLLTIINCSQERDDLLCFFFVDAKGNGDFTFSQSARYAGPAKASYDGSYLVLNLSDREGGLSAMSIYTRDGKRVSQHFQSGYMQTSGPYDWLPDGRLVYSIEGSELQGDYQPTGLIITKPYDARPARRIVLPEFYQDGTISTIESSPDGRTLLVNIKPRVGPRRPILVDVKTQAVSQLIVREDNSVANVNNVSWGSGGRWVYGSVAAFKLLSGKSLSSVGDIAFIGSSASLYAFEVNGTVHPVPRSEADLSDSLRLIQTESLRNRGGKVGGGNYKGGQVWIP